MGLPVEIVLGLAIAREPFEHADLGRVETRAAAEHVADRSGVLMLVGEPADGQGRRSCRPCGGSADAGARFVRCSVPFISSSPDHGGTVRWPTSLARC
jgi:hypothetical protein